MKEKILIIGLNDSQGINININVFKKGFCQHVIKKMKKDNFEPLLINAFSFKFNKTYHIDYFFEENISLKEIK